MILTTVRADGSIVLGDAAARAGFVPGALVRVIVTRAGSLILALDDAQPALDVAFRPLVGGAAQLALRSAAPNGKGRGRR